jgi:hypothetical protein
MKEMSRAELETLQRLIKQREKVLKSVAKQRSAELIADFENQMGSEYRFDDDEVWARAAEAAQREVKKAQAAVAARCRELGIPERFAPTLDLIWSHRGFDNSIDKRKVEMRRMAQTHIAAMEAKAFVEIEVSCLDAQTKLAVAGCASEEARALVESLPSIESLMPRLSYSAIAGEADPPIVEQLVSPGALRQRRFRERQKALRDGAGNVTDGDGDAPPTETVP